MNMPGFTAEASLYETREYHQLAAERIDSNDSNGGRTVIRPQGESCQCTETSCLRRPFAHDIFISLKLCRSHSYAVSDDGNIRIDVFGPWYFCGSC